MFSLNTAIKKTTLIELLIVMLCAYSIVIVASFFNWDLDMGVMYLFIIFYVLIKSLRYDSESPGIFSKLKFRYVLLIVLVNVFFSYGMLYLANGLNLENSLSFNIVPFISSLIGTIIISPIAEEFIFRGIILNRLKLVIPIPMAILASSLCFGVLHSYGSIISAFVFGVCMCIIYIKTENILTSIIAHIMNNFLAESLYYLDGEAVLFNNGVVMIIITILAIVSLYLIVNSIYEEFI